MMEGRYKVITLCGSTRFKDAFLETQKRLTLEGNIVISVGLFGHSGDNEVWTEGTKEMLDDMHLRKIDMADEIFVINVGGYIGPSTRAEIEYAKKNGKVVHYLEPQRNEQSSFTCPVTNEQNGFTKEADNNCGLRIISISDAKAIVEKPETAEGLKKYKYIMDTLNKTDVSTNEEFQAVFCDFYQLRKFYSERFRTRFFCVLEEMKSWSDVSFRDAFEKLREIEGSNEMSFTSKLAHTVDPSFPIWDKIVTQDHFGMKKPYAGKNPVGKYCKRYDEYRSRFYQYLKSEEGAALIRVFDERFPEAGIEDVKKVDFILWQDRK